MHSSFIRVSTIFKNCKSLSRTIATSTQLSQKEFLRRQAKTSLVTDSKNGAELISVHVDKKTFKFPSIWLRDNCQCPACFREESHSRTIDWENFDFGAKPVAVESQEDRLMIEWSDGHRSTFDLRWLIDRAFTEEKRKLFRDTLYRFERVTWGAEQFQRCLKKFDYKTLLNENSALLEWLESLTKYGVAIVTDVLPENSSCRKLTERVAFVRKTHYGEEFRVEVKSDVTNVAYLSSTLPLHTDLPYYHYSPGTNLLHCVVQTAGQGGDSQLADGFHVANKLKIENPEVYRVLTKTLVDWSDVGHENGNRFHSLYQAPILCEDEIGDLVRVNFSQPQRDSHFNAPLEDVVAWYKAAGLFTKMLYSPENFVTFKLATDEILTFDNHRLVHGRSAYTDTNGISRLVIGCYLDWDEIYSKIRVLRKELKN